MQKLDDYLYWEFNEEGTSAQAIRFTGKWKAYRTWDKKLGKMGRVKLYNLEEDPEESRDLASVNPELVARAKKILKTARTVDPAFPVALKDKPNLSILPESTVQDSRYETPKEKRH